jgi:hypothetical protein
MAGVGLAVNMTEVEGTDEVVHTGRGIVNDGQPFAEQEVVVLGDGFPKAEFVGLVVGHGEPDSFPATGKSEIGRTASSLKCNT